jgi:hypothetical protein
MANHGTTQAPASRLPATRESRPALIGLALLLIVGGALASAYLALVAGDRADFVQVDQEIAQGAVITEEDLSTVSLPEGYDGGIPAGDLDDLVGQATTVRLLAGTVLTPDMVSDDGGIAEGMVQTNLEVSGSEVAGARPGERLLLYVEGDGPDDYEEVAAELVAIGEAEEGGVTGAEGVVGIAVLLDEACNATVSAGKLADSISVSVIGASTPPGACGGE